MRSIQLIITLIFLVIICSSDKRRECNGDTVQLTDRILDEKGLLERAAKEKIFKSIKKMESETCSQLAIMIIDSLGESKIDDFGRQTIKNLKLGSPDRNNGVLIVVVWWPRDISVHVGEGLKGIVTDEVANSISDVEMERIFTQDDFEGGLTFAVDRVAGLIKNNK